MAEPHKGVYEVNREVRNEHLSRGDQKYAMYDEELSPAIGEIADAYEHEGTSPTRMDSGGLLKHTVSNDSELGKKLNSEYWRDPDELEVYTVPTVPSELMKPYQGKFNDYIDYINDVQQLSITKQFINKLASWDMAKVSLQSVASTLGVEDIFNRLYNLNTYQSIILAMEPDRVGIVRHFDISSANAGAVITNVNNNSGEDTQLGKYSSTLVGKTLTRAYQFNTTRNTHYITDYLRSVYGNNAQNIYNLTYLLNVDDSTGRLADIDNESYIRELSTADNGDYGSWNDYLTSTVTTSNSYDTAYNRFQNIYQNPLDVLSDDYTSEHYIYNPFSTYFDLHLKTGKSIDNPITLDLKREMDASKGTHGTVETTTHYSYNEGDTASGPKQSIMSDNVIDKETYLGMDSLYNGNKEDGLLYKTNELFVNRHIGSLVGRFHTSNDTDPDDRTASITQTSFTKYGMSHGRNLLTKDAYYGSNGTEENGYDNPYCRVWTYHHQYHRIKDAIRPFINDNGDAMDVESLQKDWGKGLRTNDGGKRLSENSALNKNGLVNIAPSKDSIISNRTDIKRCMFSIENLAWKDVYKTYYMNDTDQVLSPEQVGPNGGRIMWFPPYDLKFSENVSASWRDENFIGRGEPVVTYSNTTRTGQLDFTILVDHPSIVDSWSKSKSNPTEDDEQELLRFFAGCGILQPGDISPSDNFEGNGRTNNNNDNDSVRNNYNNGNGLNNDGLNGNDGDPNLNPIEDPEQTGEIIFYVFFPNNYSGSEDDADAAIQYLLKGHNNSLTITSSYQGYEMAGGGITDDGFREKTGSKWGYRLDSDYANQILNAGNYDDTVSYSLNANLSNVKMLQGLNDANCTLAEFYSAVKNITGSELTFYETYGALNSNIEKLKRILKYGEISSMEAYGGASQHGYKSINESQLSPRRRNTIRRWVSSVLSRRSAEITPGSTIVSRVSNKDVNASDAKGGRFAKMVIKYKAKESVIEGTDDENTFYRNIYSQSTTLREDLGNGYSIYNPSTLLGKYMEDDQPISTLAGRIVTKLGQVKNKLLSATATTSNSYRYDYEREYFQNLSVKDPVMHHRIVDKIKYFDPAFHSITPEGFNARLTFLHQCTRQGHTLSTSDGTWAQTAGNLSFGRPPVCVLRIGDFYHTKIIIKTLNITYDDGGIQWDTNQEGIGIQPMKAKVSLGIEFLGGSDLGAPVARLQNAVSFNYYANTSVYDNRADVMEYDTSKKKPKYAKDQWTPTPVLNN